MLIRTVLCMCLVALVSCSSPSGARDLTTSATSEARADLALTELLRRYTPEENDWTQGPTRDALINHLERTADPEVLRVIERSFRGARGWRSLDPDKLFYDDMGWYANAWLRAFDVTGDRHYLSEAQEIFAEMTDAWDETCGGGLWWNHERSYKNAITNELFLLSAARLARRVPERAADYRVWAEREWDWFKDSGMINAENLVNDGLDQNCTNNGAATWSYNQGVILGALVELWRLDGERAHLAQAEAIADANIAAFTHESGILKDVCEDFADGCTGDALIFKGMFAQGLARLYNADRENKPQYGDYLRSNAEGIWTRSRDTNNALGLIWHGPVATPSLQTHAAGTLLVGGVALLDAGGETSDPPVTSSTYEAETGVLNNLSVENIYAGYSGGGYVANWNQEGQWLDFTVNVPAAGSYQATLHYAAGAGDASRLLYVNGSSRNNVTFADTQRWDSYATLSYNLDLDAGKNTISLIFNESSGSSNYLNVDRLELN